MMRGSTSSMTDKIENMKRESVRMYSVMVGGYHRVDCHSKLAITVKSQYQQCDDDASQGSRCVEAGFAGIASESQANRNASPTLQAKFGAG